MLRFEDPSIFYQVFYWLGCNGLLRIVLLDLECPLTTEINVPRDYEYPAAGRFAIPACNSHYEIDERDYDDDRADRHCFILPDARPSYQLHRNVKALSTNVHGQPESGTPTRREVPHRQGDTSSTDSSKINRMKRR